MVSKRLFPDRILTPENLQILYEDNHIIAVNKPAGILIQGDMTKDISLLEVTRQYIKETYQKPGNVYLGLIHRLDRPASGVVVFAKTSKGASRLSEQFRSRSLTKMYWALVHGRISPPQGTLVSYLKKETKGVTLAGESDTGAQKALLTYRTISTRVDLSIKGEVSLLEVILHTGRKHQIRAQLAAKGCPIVGDLKYGAPLPLKDKTIRLIAKSITFEHPTRQETITIEAPAPDWA